MQNFTVGSGASSGTLSAILISPTGASNQPFNQTFVLYANISCGGTGSCGAVNGTIRYNASSINPDAAISTVSGTVPFYTLESNPRSCGTLNAGDAACALNWTVNATGAIGSAWKLDLNASSQTAGVASIATDSTNLSIIDQSISITISSELASVSFGSNLNPGSSNNTGTNNSNNGYTLTCAYTGGNCNVSIKGNGHLFSGVNSVGIGNTTWNTANTSLNAQRLSLSYQIINASLQQLVPQRIYFWLDVPSSLVAGTYTGNFTVQAQPN